MQLLSDTCIHESWLAAAMTGSDRALSKEVWLLKQLVWLLDSTMAKALAAWSPK